VAGSGLTVIDLYIPTIMVISFVAIAISLPNTLVRDREMGWLRRISTTPVHPSRLLAAQLIFNLVLAAAAIVITIGGGTVIFGAPLSVNIPFFILSLVLAIAEIFSLGLVVVALAPTQTVASALGGCSSLPSCSCRGCGFSLCKSVNRCGPSLLLAGWRSGAGSSLLGVQCDTSALDPRRPGWIRVGLCVRRRSVLSLE